MSETVQQQAQQSEHVAGPPAWVLGIALVVSGNIFAFWTLRAPTPQLTVILALLAFAVRVAGLGILIRWILTFQEWWAYLIAVIFVAGIATALVELLSHFG